MTDLCVGCGKPNTLVLSARKFGRDGPLWSSDRWRHHHLYGRNGHARLDGRRANRRNQCRHALRGVPGVVGVHRLKIVSAPHEDHQRQWRMDFDALRQSLQSAATGLEGVSPHRSASVQAILNDPGFVARSFQRKLKNARPALLERQALTGQGNNAPGEGVGVDEDLLHVESPAIGAGS